MEAVPRLPMLSFDLKVSVENVSFGPKLKQYIAEVYREDPDTYSNEIHQLEGLRSAAVRPAIDLTGCAALKRYFAQLRSLQSRFPMFNNQSAAVSFSWKDLFANINCPRADIRFEMLCILYNIAALHSKLGALENRNSQESMKVACTHFQTAVWAFQYLRENYPQPPGVDLCSEVMRLMQEICLAQAQECILEKSLQDNRKPGIVGSVAMQILVFYKSALAILEVPHTNSSIHETIGLKIWNTWTKAISFKIAYITSVMTLFQGMQSEEQQKMGERVAFYDIASDKLTEAKKIYKGMPQIAIIKEALSFTTDVVEGKKKAAKNENEFIYHEEVPIATTLADPKPAVLAKGIPINFNDPEVSGPDIFAKLVPMGAHEASSMYSEEKAKLLRQIGSQTETKDLKLHEFMSSLQLDHLDIINQPEKIPQDLVDRCASLSVKTDAIQNLIETMNNIADIHTDVDNMLTEIRKIIQEEEMSEREFQKIMGHRPPSIVSTELSREANKYQEAHNKANDSNQTLHKAMTIHLANLRILALPLDEIEANIPSIKSVKDNIDEAAIAEMRMLVGKVNEMQTQRAALVTQLREAVNNDDITSQLLTRTGEALDDIFKQEIEKHNKQVALIEQNMLAQENILKALTDAYAKYAPSKKLISEVIRKRESFLTGLISSYDTYEDLLSKSLKGLEFYKKLSTNVSKLLTRVKSTCKVQEEERTSLLANNAAKQQSYSTMKASIPTDSSLNIQQVYSTREVSSGAPKLKDYLPYMKNRTAASNADPGVSVPIEPSNMYPPYMRPAPVGSEGTNESVPYQYGETQQSDGQLNQNNYSNPKSDAYTTNPYMAQYQYPGYDTSAYGYNYNNQTNADSNPNPQTVNPQYPYTDASQTTYPASNQGYASVNQYDAMADQVQNMHISATPSYSQNIGAYNTATYNPSSAYNENQADSNYIPPTPNTAYSYPSSTESSIPQNVSYPQYSQTPADSSIPAYHQSYPYSSYNTNVQSYPYQTPADPNSQAYTAVPSYNPESSYQQISTPSVPSSTVPYYSPTPTTISAYPTAGTPVYPANQEIIAPAEVPTMPVQEQYDLKPQTPQAYYDQPIQSHVQQQFLPNSSSSSNLSYTYSMTPENSTAVQQQYPTSYTPNQDSYQSHPGYSYNPTSGVYEYSYGYQNSSQPNNAVQQIPTSQYTSAGGYVTTQTNSDTPVPPTNQTGDKSPYYTIQYGHQNIENVENSTNQQSTNQNNNMTYISSNKTADTNTTESGKVLKSSPSVEETTPAKTSAIDLLSGLDFNVEHEPLTPEIKVPPVSEHAIRRNVIVREKDSNIIDEKDDRDKVEEKPPKRDLFSDPSLLNTFTQEVKNLQVFVDSFTKKTHSGITMLDSKWKKIQDAQSKEFHLKSAEMAKNNMDKNASPDVYPYDDSRVTFKYEDNAYINASHIKQISSWSVPMIVSDLPKEECFKQFWMMIYQQKVNLIVCLLTEIEMQGKFYWPAAKNLDLKVTSDLSISLDEITCNVNWTERVLTLRYKEDELKIIHYQINMFPARVVSAPLVLLVDKFLRANPEPKVLIHCNAGAGRSSLIVILTMVMCQVRAGCGELREILDSGFHYLCGTRTNVLEDTKYLVDIYRTVLFYVQGVLCSGTVNFNGEAVSLPSAAAVSSTPIPSGSRKHSTENINKFTKESFEEMKQAAGLKSGDMKDPLSYLDPLWSLKKRKE